MENEENLYGYDYRHFLSKWAATPAPTILSVELIDGRLEVVKRIEEVVDYMGLQVVTKPKIWKEVYGAKEEDRKDGYSDLGYEIILLKTIPATYKPAQPESWEFEEE